jgi:hypothetical protein
MFSTRNPIHHTIVEAHPQVLQHMRDTGVYDWPGVRVLEGRWQDWFSPEKLGEVIEATPDASGFTAIFMDTFAEGYEGEAQGNLADQISSAFSRYCRISWIRKAYSHSGMASVRPVSTNVVELT